MKSEWGTIPASEYCENVADGTHDSPKQAEIGKYMITSKHLGEYDLDFADAYRISLEDYEKVIARSKVEQWDILFSMIGTIGRVYQETNANTDYAIKNVGLFRLGGDKQKSDWLKYYLKSPKAQEFIQSHLRGSTQGYIPLGALRDMPVDVPPFPEQRAIIAILSCLDDKIFNNKKVNHHLEQMAQAIFKSWFMNFEPSKPFTEVVQVLGGGTPKTTTAEYWDGSIPFFTPKDAFGLYVLSTEKSLTEKGLNNCNSLLYPVNTVFVTARGTVGKLAMTGVPMAMNQSCYALLGNNGYGQHFVYHIALETVEHLKHKASGAVFDAIVTRDFESEIVAMPPIEAVKLFEDKVKPIYEALLNNTNESVHLATLRDTLLPRLISGELSVSAIDPDK